MAHSVSAAATRPGEDDRAGRRSGVWRIVWDAVRSSRAHGLTTNARALAYSLFLAIPATLLLLLGLFSLVADEDDVERVMEHVRRVMPAEVAALLAESLERSVASPRSGVVMTIAGLVVAAWSSTSAATSLMEGVTAAFGRRDSRGFVRRRLVALVIVVCLLVAAMLLLGLLVLGPHVSRWIGNATGEPSLTSWLWWSLQWPVLIGVLALAFAIVLYLGPDVDGKTWRIISPGAVIALVVWLVASGALAVYSAEFGSYEKTWGALSAVVVTLVWLWLGAASLLFGAEIDAQLRARDDGRPDTHESIAHDGQ